MRNLLFVLSVVLAAAVVASAGAVTSAKDGRIIFENADADASGTGVFVINPDGSGLTSLTASSDAENTDPAWSPNGRQIAFVSDRGNEDGHTFVWVMNADGSAAHALGGGGVDQLNPAWSPNGKQIAFSRCVEEVEGGGDCTDGQVAVIGANGKGMKRLTKPLRTAGFDSRPSWAPNGKTIVFQRRVDLGYVSVWTISTTGKNLRRVLNDNSQAEHSPSFAPNGKQILYASDTDGPEAIYLMSDTGKARKKVVEESTDPDDPGAQGGGVENPAFAPSGKRIVYESGGELWIVGSNGTDPVQITDGGGGEPDWGHG